MKDYLSDQIITYMCNKRKLLPKIKEMLIDLEEKEGKKLNIGDGFSGSGVVSRLFKQHGESLYSNDIASYSDVDCNSICVDPGNGSGRNIQLACSGRAHL